MTIYEFLSANDIIVGIILSLITLLFLKKLGGIRSWLDPLVLPFFQIVLTTFVLGVRVIPLTHLLCLAILFTLIAYGRPRHHRMDWVSNKNWEKSVYPLAVIFIIANIIIISQKGILFLQDDIGDARQEFYQGWGLFQRFNAIAAIIFGVYWSSEYFSSRGFSRKNMILLIFSVYAILTLGSKAGVFSLLTIMATVSFFRKTSIEGRQFGFLIGICLLSILSMFWLFYGEKMMLGLGIRIISFADGPYYYYSLKNQFQVSITYPLDQLFVALRLLAKLPESSLGPRINYEYFGFDNELFGPNPQIFVESIAVFGALYPLYYLFAAAIIVSILRFAKNPYIFSLLITVAGPLLVDSQFAFSNLFNVIMAIAICGGISFIRKLRL